MVVYCQFTNDGGLLPVSPLYYDRPLSGGRKAEAGKARTPILKNYGGKYFEKTTENRNHFRRTLHTGRRVCTCEIARLTKRLSSSKA